MPKTHRYMLGSALLSLTVIASSVVAGVAEKAQDTTVCELYGQRTSPPPGRVHLKAVVYQDSLVDNDEVEFAGHLAAAEQCVVVGVANTHGALRA